MQHCARDIPWQIALTKQVVWSDKPMVDLTVDDFPLGNIGQLA